MPSAVTSNHGALTVCEVLRAGVRRRARLVETEAALSTWGAEGGATEHVAPLSR
jgi:hypothetical protein